MLEFRFRYLIFFSPDELSAMRILFYVSFAGLGLGLVTAGLDYNTGNYN